MDETDEQGREIFIQDGVLLLSASSSHSMDTSNSGSLSIVLLPNGKYSVEWKPNDLIMVEAEAQEDHEWAMVDTIGRRTRTFSGSNTNTDYQANSRIIAYLFDDLECYKLTCKNRRITFIKKSGAECATFYFPNSNADTFGQNIKAHCNVVRSRNDKNTFIFTQPTPEMHVLNKSFAELELFQDNSEDIAWHSVGNIVNNFKKRPYEAAMEAFAKLSEIVYYSPEHPSEDVANLLSQSVGPTDCNTSLAQNSDEYEVVNKVPALPPRPSIPRGTPLGIDLWEGLKDSEGRIQESEVARHIIFRGGVQPSLRIEVWKYLLNYFPWGMTNSERSILQKQKLQEYYTMKQQWKSITLGQENRFTDFHERKSLVEKDVNRTDRTNPYYANDNNPNLTTLFDILMTYVMYNFDLGYVQGMSDLLSPILCLLDNEVDAFWCFVGFMDKVQNNFDSDQENMKFQLQRVHQLLSFTNPDLANYLTQHESGNMYFCFRWLLVLFKREFSQSDIMRLWEVLWTGLPCPNFHLLISVAILDTEKDTLMSRGYGFTEILKHVNDLSMQIDLHYILSKAEGIYYQVTQSSHLSDQIRIILGIKPLLLPDADKKSTETPSEDVSGKSVMSVSGNGISMQADLEEVSYQKSIDLNFL